jgi:predicted Zn finger-like uncharacterized protein
MRLVCPNCDAEYEVDAAAIPDAGRDVQCSNCGHAWFQLPPEVEAEMAAEEALYDAPEAVTAAVAHEDPEPEDTPEPVAAEPLRRGIDESVLAVLREEAEREVEVRKAETPVVETQPELGLEAVEASGAVARRLARLKGVEPEVVVKPQSRREMLPEIEEINSTLRASSEKRAGQPAVAETMAGRNGSGFRTGFSLMLLLGVALLAVYVMAPKLALQFPAASNALTQYVAAVDGVRTQFDGLLKTAIAFLHGLTSGKA